MGNNPELERKLYRLRMGWFRKAKKDRENSEVSTETVEILATKKKKSTKLSIEKTRSCIRDIMAKTFGFVDQYVFEELIEACVHACPKPKIYKTQQASQSNPVAQKYFNIPGSEFIKEHGLTIIVKGNLISYYGTEDDHEHINFQVNSLGPGSIIGLEQCIFDIPSFEFILPAENDILYFIIPHEAFSKLFLNRTRQTLNF